jgi:glycosyltransferase involved in cell wall biosynthesis
MSTGAAGAREPRTLQNSDFAKALEDGMRVTAHRDLARFLPWGSLHAGQGIRSGPWNDAIRASLSGYVSKARSGRDRLAPGRASRLVRRARDRPCEGHAGKNILLVGNFAPDTGYAWWLMENFWLQINEMARDRGRRCLLIYPEAGPIPASIADSSIRVAVHDFRDRSPGGLGRLRRLIIDHQIGHVYLTDRRYFDWLYGLLRFWGVENIVLHDHVPGERPLPHPLKWLAKRSIHSLGAFTCDLYIGVCAFVADRLVRVGGVPPSRVSYVHNGVTLPAEDRTEPGIRESMGTGPEDVLVVNVGRAHRYKGIDFMVDVAADLVRRGHDHIRFLHVGDGPHLAEFQARAARAGLEGRFHFAGQRDDVPDILRAADVAFHTSKGEAFSLAILEYMAAGLAVLVPDHCGNPEAVDHGVDGLLYAPGDLSEAASRLAELSERAAWRRGLGDAAKEKVRRKFRIETCNDTFREILEEAMFPGPEKGAPE